MADTAFDRRTRRSRVWLVVWLTGILAIPLSLYEAVGLIEAERAKAHKQSFYQYVVEHRIGTLTEIDDGTGLSPVSYVLSVAHPPPPADWEAFAVRMMRLYATFDHGQLLTIVTSDPRTGRQRTIADAAYDARRGQMSVTVYLPDGRVQHAVLHIRL
ncbi:hypothetical protein GCM10010885_08310 [Alicyclobacillus cellulosilyticus]|uniref:Uncharacterized protein n=1 Tax=Alicyclobacillus cellulosilyticus TaxID=1003997 RepID=A0A917K7B6_9BACL|nr:hypothetical protein [Alicyclobacillus cellulosilyticus]GGJ01436.1 hypothetical protein GCM10010885_08310 [Alicyclobacillus cellulosilyticus]